MGLSSLLLVAVSLALDACAVSLAAGAGHKKIKSSSAIRIATAFAVFQFGMPLIGYFLGVQIAGIVERYDHWIAFILLAFVGGRMVYLSFAKDETEKAAHKQNIFNISVLLVLALMTSIDAFVIGVSFAFVAASILFAALVIGAVTWILSLLCVFVGKRFGELFGDRMNIVGGIILIGLGIKILLEHLGYF